MVIEFCKLPLFYIESSLQAEKNLAWEAQQQQQQNQAAAAALLGTGLGTSTGPCKLSISNLYIGIQVRSAYHSVARNKRLFHIAPCLISLQKQEPFGISELLSIT